MKKNICTRLGTLCAIPLLFMAHTSSSKAAPLDTASQNLDGFYKIIGSQNQLLESQKKQTSLISPVETYSHIHDGKIEILSINSKGSTRSSANYLIISESGDLFLEIQRECDLKNYVPVRQLKIDPHGFRIRSTAAGVDQNIAYAYEAQTTFLKLEIKEETYQQLSSQVTTQKNDCLETQSTFDRFNP